LTIKELARLHLLGELEDGDALLVVVRHRSAGGHRLLVAVYQASYVAEPLTEAIASALELSLRKGAIELISSSPEGLVETLSEELGIELEAIVR
jgi:hypothetical protein